MKLVRKFSLPMTTLVCCVLGFTAQVGAGSGIISTIAGGGEAGGPLGDGGPATSAVLNNPTSVILDSAGNFYIADERNYRIRKVDPAGIISTIAGTGEWGNSGDDGPAIEAKIGGAKDIALDSSGNLYIALDTGNIRKVDPAGVITTVAGGGSDGNGDGGPATDARLSGPKGVHVDEAGNLYFSEESAHRIRKVDPAGIITTIAGNGTAGYSGDGGAAIDASLKGPNGIFVDNNGNLYIAERSNFVIRKVDPSGIITTVAGNGEFGSSGEGDLATDVSLGQPSDIFVDGDGNLYIAFGSKIRRVDPSGIITTIAGGGFGDLGDGGPATEANLFNPSGIFLDGSGNLYIADTQNNRIRKVVPPSFQIVLTADPDFIFDAGSSTIRAEIQDRDGNLQSDDNSTLVTFQITSGEGTLSDEQVTASGGVATTTLTSETHGVVNIEAGALDSEDGILSVEVKGPTAVIALTADLSILTADGSDASTIRAEVRDLSGNLKTDDNRTVVTFRIMGGFVSEGGGSLSSESVTASGGVATTTFRGSMPGQVIVEASASGALGVTVIVSVFRPPSQTGPFGPPPVLEIGPGEIGTVAGGWIGDGGPAIEAGLNAPQDLFVDGAGNLYIADNGNNRIRKVDTSGIITTVAGTGDGGFEVDEGGPATNAQIALPLAVTVDALGNIYLAQFRTVWKVDTSGIITRVAGGPGFNTGGDGGPARDAKVESITAIAVDGSGNLFIATERFNRVRKVDPSGIISTAASINGPTSLAVDASGNLYILSRDPSINVNLVQKMAPSGTITTIAGGGGGGGIFTEGSPATEVQLSAFSISVDAAGNLYILGDDRVLRVDLSGAITTVAEGNIGRGRGIALNNAGEIYIGFAPSGSPPFDHRVRKIGTDGSIVTVAGTIGDGRPATQASFINPQGITMDNAGNIYIADSGNGRVRRVDPTGTITTIAGGGTARGSGFPFIEFVGPATEAALSPSGLAIDASGNLYIAEGQKVRKVDPSGTITTVAGGGSFGNLGDGGPATEAYLNWPIDVSVDASGNLYVVEWQGHRIRKVDPSGIITTFAGTGTQGFSGDGGAATGAKLNQPYGVFADGSGSLYIADQGNNRVRKVDPSGTITTVAGKSGSGPLEENIPAIEANLFSVSAVFVDGSGNLFIALGFRVVKVDLSGIITTVAGDRIAGHVGDGGPATAAAMQPRDIFVDDLGGLYIADTRHNRIRKVVIVPSQTTDTPAGTDVPIAFSAQTSGAAPVSMTFGQVTQAGETTLETSGSGPATPGGFKLIDPSVFYQITTTAAFEGSIELCLDYTGLNVTNESELKLFHLENSVWADVTTSQDTQDDIICGSVTSLSPFALFEIPLPPPQPAFREDTTSGVDSLTVKFTDFSVGVVTAWVWSFGDGDSSFVQNPSHTYTVGTFTVILTVTGPGGSNTFGKSQYISVLEGVKADFSPDTTSGRVPLTVAFRDTSTGPVTDWLWTFGDGDSSAVQNPTHTYQAVGTYSVNLKVFGAGGDSSTAERADLIVVSPNLSPSTPVSLLPSDGAIRVPLSPSLTWGSSIDPEGDPVSYDVFLGPDRVGSTSDTTQMVGPLDEDTGYTWHIVSKDDRGGSAEGATRAFTTVGDTLPPVVTRDPVVEAITQSGFRVVWRVDERSTPSVSVRVSGETTFTTSPEGSLGRDQRVDVTDLSSATTYEFRVTSRDSSGNETTFPDPPYLTATTLAEADTEGPLFTVPPAAEHVSDTLIVVVWKTNESSSTELLYRVESDTAFVTGPAGAAGTNHRGAIGGLTPGTTYVLKARSVDASGNPAVGPDLMVTTAPPVVEAVPIRVSNVSVVGRTESQAIIDWSTNQPGSSVVEYGLSSTLRTSQTETGEDGVLEHRVTLSRLAEDTPYFYRAISGGDTSDVFSFRTRKAVPPAPAVITEGPLVRGIGEDRATVLWKTDVVANSTVEFDTTETFTTQAVSDPDPVTDHGVTLTGLSTSTTYYYRAKSVNLSRLTTESDVFSFTTLDAPDTTPPSILELSVPVRTSDGFIVTWRTNEIGTSEVIYGVAGGSEQSRISPGFAVDHSLSLSGLSELTTYVIRVLSADPAGNAAESDAQEVTTLSEAVVDVSSPKLVRAPSAAGSSHEGATIVWGTDEPGNSLVAYGVSEDDLSEEQGDARRFTTDHSVRLTNLESAEIYFFQVSSTDAFGNGPTIGTGMFTTQAAPDTISVSITEGPTVVSVTDESTVLSWKTNELSDTQVDYAAGSDPTAAGLTQRIILPAAVTDHQVTLTNLSPSTGYAFRAGSQDVARNPRTFSTDRTFTTEAAPDTIPPDLVGAVTVSERTSTTITLVYTTDEPTNTVVEYGLSDYSLGRIERGSLELTRSATLTGLTSDTEYRFRISSRDREGNGVTTDPTITIPPPNTRLRSDDLRSTTTAEPDVIEPAIVEGPIVSVSGNNVVVRWITDELSDSRVIYATPANYNRPGLESEVFDGALVTVHRITLSLDLNTQYLFRTLSTDAAGNTGTSDSPGSTKPAVDGLSLQAPGADGSFETALVADTSPPVILSGPTLVGATSTSLILQWITNEASNSFVEYSVGGQPAGRVEDGTPLTQHRLVLTKLVPGTTYTIEVGSTDPSGNGPSVSRPGVGSTTAEVDASPPRIIEGPEVFKSDREAVIIWKTDEPGNSTVEYGTGSALSLTRSIPDAVTEHRVILANLTPDASYSFRVGSVDISNNGPTLSSIEVFQTDPTPDTTPPDIASDPDVTAITDQTATVSWETNEVSDSGVSFGTSASALDFNIGSSEAVKDHRQVLTGLEPATTYFLQVSSTDRSGNGPTFSPASAQTVSFTTEDAPDMSAPTKVQEVLGVVGSRAVHLTWEEGSEDDLAGYNVYRATGEDELGLIASNLIDPRFQDVGLTDEVAYRYAVAAFDGAGNEGEKSDESAFTPSEANVPTAPAFLTIEGEALIPTFVVENATAPGDADLVYTFQVSAREDFADLVDSATDLPEGNESTETGLTAWTITRELTQEATYFLRVRANDGTFDGPFTPPQPFLVDTTVVSNPGDFDGSFKVDFDDFFLFAAAFGQPATGDNAVFDMSGDGQVNFDDFFEFAGVFGVEYEQPGGATKPVASSRTPDPSLRVGFRSVGGFPKAGEAFTAHIDLQGMRGLNGYGIRVEFDPNHLELLHVEQPEGVLAQVLDTNIDEVVVLNYGDAIDPEAKSTSEDDGSVRELVLLRFRVKVSSLDPPAWVSEFVLLDPDGELLSPDLASARLFLRPDQVVLMHNYPNPFNPVTTIRYGIPEEARVSILVYNILGQEVAKLVDEPQAVGFYTVDWNGRDGRGRQLASGVYLYRIKVGNVARVQKMILLK